MSETTPLVTASRDALAEVIGAHSEHYDSDCGYYFGCDCGWDNGTQDNNDGYAEHVADAILAAALATPTDPSEA